MYQYYFNIIVILTHLQAFTKLVLTQGPECILQLRTMPFDFKAMRLSYTERDTIFERKAFRNIVSC